MGRFIFATAVGVWLGTVVSFSFVMLPTIHAVLSGRATLLRTVMVYGRGAQVIFLSVLTHCAVG